MRPTCKQAPSMIIALMALIFALLPDQLFAASMTDYCLIPPYVKKDVKPNVMITIDNAKDMGDPAYCTKDSNFNTNHTCYDNYIPTKPDGTPNSYYGYFRTNIRYRYSGGTFVPDNSGIYSGNLLNWATTSKYDLLQYILVGGISTSRQANVNTLISKSNQWRKVMNYTDSLGRNRTCVFNVNNANVEITDATGGSCGYLDTPTAYPLTTGDPAFMSFLDRGTDFAVRTDRHDQRSGETYLPNHPGASSPGFLSKILSAVVDFLVPSAEAAQLRISGGPSNLTDGIECTPYNAVGISASGGTGPYSWDVVGGGLPPGLDMTSTGTPLTTIYGTPTAANLYSFTVRVRDSSSPQKSDTKTFTINVLDATVDILINDPVVSNVYQMQNGYVGSYYHLFFENAAASVCKSSFTWSITGNLPPGLSYDSYYSVPPDSPYNWFELYGFPTTSGTYNFTLQVKDGANNTASRQFQITIAPAQSGLAITAASPLNDATQWQYFLTYLYYQPGVPGVSYPLSFSISGSLPPGMYLEPYGGDPLTGNSYGFAYLYGTPMNAGTYTFTLTVSDSSGQTVSKQFTLNVIASQIAGRSSDIMNVQVCTGNYTYNCGTALPPPPSPSTDPWPTDSGCSESDKTQCILKSGLIDQFWSQARFAVMDFNKASQSGNSYASPNIANCIEQDPGTQPDPDFMTAVENAVGIDPTTTLVNAEYEAVNYFATGSGNCDPYTGAQTCVKNFNLILTAGVGADNPRNPSNFLTPEVFSSGTLTACSGTLSSLAQNSCYGYNVGDLKSATPQREYVTTYIVNTMGTTTSGTTYNPDNAPVTTGDILYQAAKKGGGLYYEAVSPGDLTRDLEKALKDIIKRAAAGTAASVLASGEGSGANLVQAVFYPRRKFGNDEIDWIGRLTNLWYYVDPNLSSSTIREDAGHDNGDGTFGSGDKILTLKTDTDHNDHIVQLFFDTINQVTKAHRWNDTNGDALIDTQLADVEFEKIGSLWEAGGLLWNRDLSTSPRSIYTSLTGTTRIDFSTANKSALRSYLTASTDAYSEAIIRYVQGEDTPFSPAITGFSDTYRSRSVIYDGTGLRKTWKLGDVLNSTPKISSWLPLNSYHKMFNDVTYGVPGQDPSLSNSPDNTRYITSDSYRGRNMIFTGANDGMLHAFRLGTLELNWSGQGTFDKARLTGGSDLGQEVWAFIPKNALPFLKYTADPSYCHVYTVDLTPFIFDASIGTPTGCTETDTSNCVRTVNSWRTILIGGMRFGGGCRKTCTGGNCVNTPADDPVPNEDGTVNGLGYSSYFALDITDQDNPQVLWEFSNDQLGFATAGPAVVRQNALVAGTPEQGRNGKWYVVLASGPTGPINTSTNQFLGHSDQNLRLFILDLKTGSLLKTIDTGVQKAFAGSMLNSTLDTGLDYQDDVVYIPYVKDTGDSTWTSGGVLRLSTNQDATHLAPTNWSTSTLIDNIGPVTASVAKLLNNTTHLLWTFFGTGRYYFSQNGSPDDALGQRQIFGVKEPCFGSTGFDSTCTSSRALGDLDNVTNISAVRTDPDSRPGWYINLDGSGIPDASVRAERVITDPLAATTGVVFFTTFKPYSDECALGGKSFIWAVKYNSGGDASALLKGQALIQVSTGSIEQLNLSQAFTDSGHRKSAGMEGVPPTAQGLSIMTTPPPVKRVLHVKER